MATVKLFGNLRKHISGSHLQISGTSIQTVVENLCERHPPICAELLEDGNIRPYFKIMINGHDIQLADGLDSAVSETDQVAIFPPIAGG